MSVVFVLLEFGNVAKHTFVDQVFGGVFISSVQCHVCYVVCVLLHCVFFPVYIQYTILFYEKAVRMQREHSEVIITGNRSIAVLK